MSSFSEMFPAAGHHGAVVLIDASIKAAVVLLVAATASCAVRRASAAIRHRVWSLSLCGALPMPVLSLTVPQVRLAILPAPPPPTELVQDTPPLPTLAVAADAATPTAKWLAIWQTTP